MSSWQDFYAKVTNPYGAPGPHYNGGHHGDDFHADPHEPIPSYITGVCVLNGHSSVLGNYTVLRDADGEFISWAHLLVGTRPDVGQKLKPGDPVGRAAGAGDDHGSAWDGPHCHTTRSRYLTGVYDGRTLDPWPKIAAAIKSKVAAPKKRTSTRVRPGEGGIRVAARVRIPFARLQALNPGVNMNKLRLAQKLWTS